MRPRNGTTLLFAAAIGLLVSTSLTAEAQQIKLKFSSFEPPTAALTARVIDALGCRSEQGVRGQSADRHVSWRDTRA